MLPAALVAYFEDAPWTAALAVVPTYWPAQVYWALLNESSAAWPLLVLGLGYQSLLLALLLRRLDHGLHRVAV